VYNIDNTPNIASTFSLLPPQIKKYNSNRDNKSKFINYTNKNFTRGLHTSKMGHAPSTLRMKYLTNLVGNYFEGRQLMNFFYSLDNKNYNKKFYYSTREKDRPKI